MKKQKVKELIEKELLEIQQTISIIQSYLQKLKELSSEPDKVAVIMAVVLGLHLFYRAVEEMFIFIARSIDYLQPMGDDYRRELLYQMTLKVPDVRPQVISESTELSLDYLRRFLDVARNRDDYQLEHESILELANKAPALYETLKEEITQFLESLP
ncbi:MAG: hypothetical protein AB4060_08820 [Crocosphaera sp.]